MKHSWSIAFGLVVATLCTPLIAGQGQSAQVMLEAARKAETIDGNPKAAIAQYEAIVKRFPNDRAVVADALVRMAGAYRKLGDKQATAIYQRVVREYGDQAAATVARAALRPEVGAAPTGGTQVTALRRVWSGDGVDITGSVSRDGRYLSFTDWTTGDLAIRDLATQTNRRLTDKGPWSKSPAYAERSVFSPDGRYLAYGWANGGQAGREIRILDLQNPSSAHRRLTKAPVPWIAPYDWSADGRWIAVTAKLDDGRGTSLLALDVQSGEMKRLCQDKWSTGIRFTPDSRAVAVDRRQVSSAMATDIIAVSLEDGREHTLVTGGARNVPVGWSPDGGLLFASNRGGSEGLWLQPLQRLSPSGKSVLLKGDVGMTGLGIASSGALFFGSAAGNYETQVVGVDRATARVEAESARSFEPYVGINVAAAWSPDGSALALVNRRGRAGQFSFALTIRTMSSGVERELIPALRAMNFPKWFPDGRSLVVNGMNLQEQGGIFRIDAETGDASPLVLSGAGLIFNPQPSPDGLRLFYHRLGPGEGTIVERTLSSGVERVVQKVTAIGGFVLSPDGQSIAIVQRDAPNSPSVVTVVPVAGGATREIHRDPSNLGLTAWMPDGAELVGVRMTADVRKREAVLIPVDGGPVRRIDLPDTAGGVAVHPDGRQFAYQMGERLDEVWVLENFLPAVKSAKK